MTRRRRARRRWIAETLGKAQSRKERERREARRALLTGRKAQTPTAEGKTNAR